jgi:hypothetical protein
VARPVYFACALFTIEMLLAMHCCSEIQLAMLKIQLAHARDNTIMNSKAGSVDLNLARLTCRPRILVMSFPRAFKSSVDLNSCQVGQI